MIDKSKLDAFLDTPDDEGPLRCPRCSPRGRFDFRLGDPGELA